MPAYSIQFRRGTAADHSAFTGELAEITIDITNNRVILHDGETAGGIPLAKVTDLPIDVGDLTDVNGHIAAAISELAGIDISTATLDSNVPGAYTYMTKPDGIALNNDGTKIFVVGNHSKHVIEWNLTTPFDLSTFSGGGTVGFETQNQVTLPIGLNFNNSGTKMYVACASSDKIYQYSLSSAFDITTLSYDNVSLDVGFPMALTFNPSGTKLYVSHISAAEQYSLSTAFDISTATSDNVSFAAGGFGRGLTFNDDGTKLFLQNGGVKQNSLSIPYDLSTASYDDITLDLSDLPNPKGIAFNNDFTKMYVVDEFDDSIFQYSIGS
jgi:DNA-binding beta-propeller fold protein YncE